MRIGRPRPISRAMSGTSRSGWAVRVSERVRVAALLVIMAVTGVAAVLSAPVDGSVIGIWPVGAASAALIVARGRWLAPLLALVLLVAVATIALSRPVEVAVGYGLGITVETWVVWRLLGGHADRAPALRTDAHLLRYLRACAAGALTMAAIAALTSLVTGFGRPWLVAVAIFSAHLASQLILVPLFCRLPDHQPVAGRRERAVQWLALLAMTPAVFTPTDFPSLAFLVIPVLAWSALRLRPLEALGQLCLVMFFAIVMTTFGFGPFAGAPGEYGLPPDVRGALLAAYGVTCVLIVVPMLIRVGQQTRTVRRAAAERDRLENVVRGTPGVAIIGTDATGRVTLFNPGAERLLGYRADEVLGRASRMFHSEETIEAKAAELDVPATYSDVVRALLPPEVGATEMGFRRKDGEERSHSLTISRTTDGDGRVVGYVSTSEDITERLMAENALKEAVERLREVDAVKDAFISTVSHELRTPITSISGYLELLLDGAFGELDRRQLDALGRIESNSRRLLALIDDLLILSRVQAGHVQQGAERAFDLRLAVEAGYAVAAPAAQRGLRMSLDLPADPVPFLGSRDQIERVVVNLVGNAVKFTPDGGEVRVELVVLGAEAELAVCDTGIGIPVEEHGRLFQRFFRAQSAQRHAIQGSGLGLSIAQATVEQHGGRIEVESAEGAGTTFRVRLPVVT